MPLATDICGPWISAFIFAAIAGDIGSAWSSLQMLKMPSVKPWCAASVCGRAKRYTSRWWPWPENFTKWMADDIEGFYIFGWLVGCWVVWFVCLFIWWVVCFFNLIGWFSYLVVYVWRVATPKHPCLWAEIHLTKFPGRFLFMDIFLPAKLIMDFLILSTSMLIFSGSNSWKDAQKFDMMIEIGITGVLLGFIDPRTSWI